MKFVRLHRMDMKKSHPADDVVEDDNIVVIDPNEESEKRYF